ncbi:MAG: hypothetical protein HOP36_08115 [Methyloglobulus sp.]|nr:hypothetical protein [Methyloglobulus sp.]
MESRTNEASYPSISLHFTEYFLNSLITEDYSHFAQIALAERKEAAFARSALRWGSFHTPTVLWLS